MHPRLINLQAPSPAILETGNAAPPQAADALQHFMRSSEAAERAFEVLTQRVNELKAELQDTNQKLRDKVQELDRLSGHLSCLLESMSDGVVAVDTGAAIRLFNAAAERLSGQSSAQLLGQSLNAWLPNDSRIHELVRQALRGERNLGRLKLVVPGKGDAEPRPLVAGVAPVFDKDHAAIGAVLVFQDLGEIQALEGELKRANKLAEIGRLAAVIAHEIRNPLGGIQGFAALLQSDLAAVTPQRKLADAIVNGVQDLEGLVQGLLDYSRPLQLKLESVRLDDLLSELCALVFADPRFNALPIKRRVTIQTARPQLLADRTALRQVFLNLVRNAVEAMETQRAGELRIRIADASLDGFAALCIEIADTGPGLSEKIRGKLFQPFASTKRQGNGLGLPTVAKLAEAHGGQVNVQDEPGGGTCFRVFLPSNEKTSGPNSK